MREHMGLYRGKRSNGEWVEGFYMNLGGKYHYILDGKLDITGGFPDLVKYEVDPDTVGECTGDTDKNGKLIFEDDVVLVLGRHIDRVIFSHGLHGARCASSLALL